jgi:hypothetical protein
MSKVTSEDLIVEGFIEAKGQIYAPFFNDVTKFLYGDIERFVFNFSNFNPFINS